MTEHTIGVDISKDTLDVFDNERQEVRRFDNTGIGFRDLSIAFRLYVETL